MKKPRATLAAGLTVVETTMTTTNITDRIGNLADLVDEEMMMIINMVNVKSNLPMVEEEMMTTTITMDARIASQVDMEVVSKKANIAPAIANSSSPATNLGVAMAAKSLIVDVSKSRTEAVVAMAAKKSPIVGVSKSRTEAVVAMAVRKSLMADANKNHTEVEAAAIRATRISSSRSSAQVGTERTTTRTKATGDDEVTMRIVMTTSIADIELY